MGAPERGALEGPSEAVPEPFHLLEAPEDVGRRRHMVAGVEDIFGRTRRGRCSRLAGGLCRREFCPGKKRGSAVGKTKRGKGTKWMVVVDGQGVPLGGTLHSASPAEATLVEGTLETIAVPRCGPGRPKKRPERLIADRAYDSDPLRERLSRKRH